MLVCSLRRDREKVDPPGKGGGEKLKEVRGGEAIIGIYCIENVL